MKSFSLRVTPIVGAILSIFGSPLPGLCQEQHLEEVVVSSTPLQSTLFESAQPVSVLSGRELDEESRGTLGETLSSEPGISSSSFGPGASRPVIRGFSGDRIRVLENGVGTGDASNTSPDHAVSIEPLLADSVEVVRGPATLLYGTSAVGGVVNVIDNRIPEDLPAAPATGALEIRGGTNAYERATVGEINAPFGPLAIHLDGALRKTDDIRIPGFARTEEERNSSDLEFPEPRGKLPFSGTDTRSFAIGSSYILSQGFLGASGSGYDSEYGVPNGENDISIDLKQRRLDLRGMLAEPLSGIKQMDLKAGFTDYEHTEFEGAEEGTKFKNEAVDARYELTHETIGSFDGVAGLQFQTSDFSAIGEEAFQPPSNTDIYSGFLFEETPVADTVKYQLGLRIDRQDLDTDGFEGERVALRGAVTKHFTTLSASTGLVWTPSDPHAVALSLSYTERAPSAQELLANGPHVATAAFEIGDPDLSTEKSFGVDLNWRKRSGRTTGSIGGFYNHFEDYIDLVGTGEIEDDLPVFRFVSERAEFFGLETEVAYHLLGEFNPDTKQEDLALFLRPDFTLAYNAETGDPLPRIPPFRLAVGLDYSGEATTGKVEVQQVFRQDRNSPDETETDGYTFLNASIGYRITVRDTPVELFLRGTNLLNEKARNHVSFIKDVAPLAGTDVVAGMRMTF